MVRYFVFLIACVASFPIHAQSFNKARLDSFFDILERENRFMGSIAVSKEGKQVYSRSVGFSDVSAGIKANEQSVYRIGSISKTFTAVLVMKAVEENRIDLESPLSKYFPEIPNAEKIRLEHLLNHRSGIHNFTDDSIYLSYNTQRKSKAEMLSIIVNAGSDFEPGTKVSYSNSNYVLLSYILETEFRKTYPEILNDFIIKPLKLKNTRFGGKINTKNADCNSYSFSSQWKEEAETDMSIPMGAGGIVSNPGDLIQFSDALFGGKLLKQQSLEKMKTIQDGFGMGLFTMPFNGQEGFGHTGGIDAFTSVFSYFPTEKLSYALNSNGTRMDNNMISIAVLSAFFNRPFSLPEFSNYVATELELEGFSGTYASEQLPLKITVRTDKKSLSAQATGQSSFPLEAVSKGKFQFVPAGIEMEFNSSDNSMVLKQGGASFLFRKEP